MDLESLRRRWLSERVAVLEGLPEADLQAFEHRHAVTLPADFRAFYRTMNGMESSASDDDLVRFWPLSEVRQARGFTADDIDEGLFAFVDWALDACVYAIALRDGRYRVGTVVEACTDEVVSGSFREFVEANLLAPSRNWPVGRPS